MDAKKKMKKSKVGIVNPDFEMIASESVRAKVSPFLNNIKEAQDMKKNDLSGAKFSASKWKDFVTKKRVKRRNRHEGQVFRTMSTGENISSQTEDGAGLGLDDIHDDYLEKANKMFGSKVKDKSMSSASNRALIQYFAKLGHTQKDDEIVDLDFVETLLDNGADINCTDKHGQTLLHEVSSRWHTDVAKFLIDKNADVNRADNYGRTPLHVAAADDYPDMIELLISRGAEKEAKTTGELQTPVHYAAKNDATKALRALIKYGCEFRKVRDYKGRTPLFVASELDRSESAHELLELEAPAGLYDYSGQSVIAWMICKMPPMARNALDQFHQTDRPNRRQYFFINLLMQHKDLDKEGKAQSPLQVAVRYRQFELLTHPVFLTLLDVMWRKFARWRAIASLIFNFIYILLWTVYGVVVEYQDRHKYELPDHWWRIALLIAAVGITIWQIIDEIGEFRRSMQVLQDWKDRRSKEIDKDLEFCHPRWPSEKKFLDEEKAQLLDTNTRYFSDYWNVFDWVCYTFLMAVITTHVIDVVVHSELVARLHIRLTAITIIFLWLRLMKNFRMFAMLGPFIVIIGKMSGDLVRFAFLYVTFFIPYVCAFWMLFGGDKFVEGTVGNVNGTEIASVEGFGTYNEALFTLFRMTLVDEYQYYEMKAIDSVMTDILVGTWLAFSAVVCLNLLIALLSDTFQRVYDNAQANSVMQRAITILAFWEGMSDKSRATFVRHIDRKCSPLSQYYDDDLTDVGGEDLKKATIQIRDQMEQLRNDWDEQFGTEDIKQSALEELRNEDDSSVGGVTNKGRMLTMSKFQSEVDSMKEELQVGISALQEQQDRMFEKMKKDMKYMKAMMSEVTGHGSGGARGQGSGGFGGEGVGGWVGTDHFEPGVPDASTERPASRPRTAGKKKKKRKDLEERTSLLEAPVSSEMMMRGIQPGYFASSHPQPVEVMMPEFPPLSQLEFPDPSRGDYPHSRSTHSTDLDHSTA